MILLQGTVMSLLTADGCYLLSEPVFSLVHLQVLTAAWLM